MAKTKEAKAKKGAKLFVVLQEGGSSADGWYATSYDTKKDAQAAMRGHEKASYNSVGPFEVPPALAKVLLENGGAEAELMEMLHNMTLAMAREA